MIFLGRLEEIEENKFKAKYVHYMPFDEQNGLNKTKEQLEQEGMLVEYIPEPQRIEGKQAEMYVNPSTKEIFYEYVDIHKPSVEPVDQEKENLQKRITALEKSNAEMLALISSLKTPTV